MQMVESNAGNCLLNIWYEFLSPNVSARDSHICKESKLICCMKSEKESDDVVTQLYLILPDLMDCGLPGSPVQGILQARILE